MFGVFSGPLKRPNVRGEGSGDKFNFWIKTGKFFLQLVVIKSAANVIDHMICEKIPPRWFFTPIKTFDYLILCVSKSAFKHKMSDFTFVRFVF